ncbi:MAG: hypothetical protein HC836_25805 [Richelia sp. RM2_1_2]|nr:hypothetical protein [Richelia sp. RM2_1_2]
MAEYTFATFRNASDLKFTDISSELIRVYQYPGGEEIVITGPIALNTSKSGGHRVFDTEGTCHYITPGWRQISWKVKEGQPHFVK